MVKCKPLNQITNKKYGHDIDHIAVAVKDISAATDRFIETLDAKIIHDEVVESQGVTVRFLKAEKAMYELLQPLTDQSTVWKFLQKRGEGLHHIAFRVDDIYAEYARLSALDLQLLQKEPVLGARNKLVFFIHPRDMGGILTEICQPQ